MSESKFPDPLQLGEILIVDDEKNSRMLMGQFLKADGHEIHEAKCGERALQVLSEKRIDVVLLDIVMPGMDGYSVCRTIKETAALNGIPVILVSGLQDTEHQHRGVASGADDFFTKPVDSRMLRLRVRNAVRMKKLHDRVQAQLENLSRLEESREALVEMLVQDMRAIMVTVSAGVDALKLFGNSITPEQRKATLDTIEEGTNRLSNLIDEIVDVNQAETGRIHLEIQPCDLELLARKIEQQYRAVGNRNVRTEISREISAPQAFCDPALIERIVNNLVSNVLVCHSQPTEIVLGLGVDEEGFLRFSVRDFSDEHLPEDRWHSVEGGLSGREDSYRSLGSNGTGLTFCRLAVESMGGRIGMKCENSREKEIWLELPTEEAIALPS